MTETLTWHPAHTGPIVLSDDPHAWLSGVAGRFMPPVDVTDRPNRAGSGAILEQVREDARTIDIPIVITGNQRANIATLADALSPHHDGRLVAAVDGQDLRQIECRYIDGFQGLEQLPHVNKTMLTFKAWRPYWEDIDPSTATFNLGDLETWLPWEMDVSPIRTVPDNIFAEVEINNDGHVDAWPVWTLEGPFNDVILRDELRGDMLLVDWAAGADKRLVIDTRPGRKTVRDQDDISRFDLLDPNNDTFFPFPRGLTTVAIELAGATLESQVTVEWRRRWRTPW